MKYLTFLLLAVLPASAESVTLTPAAAQIVHDADQHMLAFGGDRLNFWNGITSYPTWEISVKEATEAKVTLLQAKDSEAGDPFVIEVGSESLSGNVKATGAWEPGIPVEVGTLKLPAGEHVLKLRVLEKKGVSVMDFYGLVLEGDLAGVTVRQQDLSLPADHAVVFNPPGSEKSSLENGSIRFKNDPKSYFYWTVNARQAAELRLAATYSSKDAGTPNVAFQLADTQLTHEVRDTGDWGNFQQFEVGTLPIPAGEHRLKVSLTRPGNSDSFHLSEIKLLGKADGLSVLKPSSNVQAGPFSDHPGWGQKLSSTHPSTSVSVLPIEKFFPKIGGIAFLEDGTMAVTLWDYTGGVWFINGYQSGNPQDLVVRKFAEGLAEPLGITTMDGRIFVCQKQELTELIDHDKDGVCDEYRCISNAWPVTDNFHQFTFGPVAHEGKLYLNLAVAINPGGATTVPQAKDRGTCIAVDPDTGEYEIISAGLRTPNGINITSDGEIFVTDNQGDWLPGNKMMHIRPGKFFNNKYQPPHPWSTREVSPPVVWYPQNDAGNSPTQPVEIPDEPVFAPYQKQILTGDIHHGGLKRVFYEEINGQLQGVVFRFAQDLAGGTHRLAFGPDKALYVGTNGSFGNWGIDSRSGLQRVSFNGKTTFEMLAVRAKSDGIEIEFTEPLTHGQGWDENYYRLSSWTYVPTENYGGPKVDEFTPEIRSVNVSEDQRKVFLELGDMKPGYLVHILLNRDLTSESGQRLFTGEAWYTMNQIPSDRPGTRTTAPDNRVVLGAILEEDIPRSEVLYRTYCISCHSLDGTRLVGPSFKNLLGSKQTVILASGEKKEITVDRDYILRGIIDTAAEYPESYQPIMPATLHEVMKRDEIEDLVDWISGLK